MKAKRAESPKVLSLRPYSGAVEVYTSPEAFAAQYQDMHFEHKKTDLANTAGKFALMEHRTTGERRYLVLAPSVSTLVHELSHVALCVFEHIGADPREGNGEPYCYLIGQMMVDLGYGA